MTKKELHLTVVGSVLTYLENNKVNSKIVEDIRDILDTHLAPKNGGKTVDLSTVVRKDDKGKVVEIQCAKSGVWLPANALNFYKQNNGKGIIGTDGESLHRTSLQGNKVVQEHNKAVKASKDAILDDLASGKLSQEEIAGLQTKLKQLNDSKPNFSKVKPVTAEPAAENAQAEGKVTGSTRV